MHGPCGFRLPSKPLSRSDGHGIFCWAQNNGKHPHEHACRHIHMAGNKCISSQNHRDKEGMYLIVISSEPLLSAYVIIKNNGNTHDKARYNTVNIISDYLASNMS
jgi:hypothetical protein